MDQELIDRIRKEVGEELQARRPGWWHAWYSPATAMLGLALVTILLSVNSRFKDGEATQKSLEESYRQITNRVGQLEGQIVTKDWLAREIQYQRETYASKASVDLVASRMEEFQRQLNTIEQLQRQQLGRR